MLTTQVVDSLSVVEGGPNAALRIGTGEFSFLKGTVTEVHTLERTASAALPNAFRRDVAPLVTVGALARMAGELEAAADRNGGARVRMGPDGQPGVYDPAPEAAWRLDQANRAVAQPVASDPSLFLSPFVLAGQTIRARLSAPDGPGFMGFVFGYQDPGHFCLLDWKQGASTHPEFGAAPRGLRLRMIHISEGGSPTGPDLWSSPDPARVTVPRTHDIPWVAGREYEIVFRSDAGKPELSILDRVNALVAWTIEGYLDASGRFGY